MENKTESIKMLHDQIESAAQWPQPVAPAINYSLLSPPGYHLAGSESLGDNTLQGELLLLQVLSRSILDLELGHGVAESRLDLLLLATLEPNGGGGVGDHLLNTGDVGLELLSGLELLAEGLVAGLELLSVVDHVLNLGGRELADGVGDGDVGGAARGLLSGGDLEDTVDIDLEDDLEDGITSLHGRDGSQSELTKGGVVFAVNTLTLEDGELDGLLVVGNSGECPLLYGGDSLTAGNNGSEDVALHGNTKGKRDNIEKEQVSGVSGGGLSGEDTSLDGGTVSNSLIGVDALLELLATEEVAKELLDLGDTGGTTDEHDLVNLVLSDSSILQDLLNRLEGTGESLLVQVLETSTGDVGVEVLAIEQRIDLNSGLGGVGKGTLGTLASSSETTKGTGIARDTKTKLVST